RHVALSILYSFYNASRLAALGAVRALRGVHDLLAIRRFGDLGHFLNTLLLIHSLWRAAGTTAHKTGTSGGCGMKQKGRKSGWARCRTATYLFYNGSSPSRKPAVTKWKKAEFPPSRFLVLALTEPIASRRLLLLG